MNLSTTFTSPKRGIMKGAYSSVLEKSMMLNQNKKLIKHFTIWTIINFAILCLVLYDLSFACPSAFSYFQYTEWAIVFVNCMSILYYIVKILVIVFKFEQIPVTLEQKKLLGIKDFDTSYKIVSNETTLRKRSPLSPNTVYLSTSLNSTSASSKFNSTPMNSTASSWMSSSPNESGNRSLSTSWIYQKGGSIQSTPKQSPYSKLFSESFKIDPITDETSLDEYLKEQETFEKINRVQTQSPQSTNLLSSFWRHPLTKNSNDSLVLSKCKYQLSPLSRDKNIVASKIEENSLQTSITAIEPWTKINVDIVALTQWNENLRKWISQTILERLVNEIDALNKTLEKHGLNDIRIGLIGLDRLRKTALTIPVGNIVPSLRTLIPFLEVTPNQEYLVKRIKQLSKGGCMSDFKWNSGVSHNGKPWNDSLPTDCAIVMHLLATYLDTQLMPLPNAPDVKPFSGYHYIKCNEKVPTLDNSSIFIHQISDKPPHYRIIIGDKIYEMGKGYNNMFHSILFFLFHINKMGQGMIGRVNLGRAGVNMLWIIDQ